MSVTIAHTDANGLLNAEARAAVTALIGDQAITGTEKTDLTDGGDTTLHHHDSDRDRANHTGTQSMSTVTSGTTSDGVLVDSTTVLSAADKTDLTDGGNTTLHGHTGAKIDISALGESRTVTTLADYLANNADYNVKDYGASTSGTAADNTTAINTAITKAAAGGGGRVIIRPGITYNQADIETDPTVEIIDQSKAVERRTSVVKPFLPGFTALEIIAHRGGDSGPENTLVNFGLATGRAHGVEFDIDFTSDVPPTPIVIHDLTLDRTTDGSGPVNEATLATIQGLDAGSWFDARFAGAHIPTLKEALAFCAPRFQSIWPEIKRESTDAQVKLIVDAIIAAGVEDRCYVQSFWTSNLPRVRKYSKRITLAYLCSDAAQWNTALPLAEADGNAVILPDIHILDINMVKDARSRGVDVVPWVVDTLDDVLILISWGVTRYISNTLVNPRLWL